MLASTGLGRRFGGLVVASVLMAAPACSLRTYAINMVGDALASGDSVYETDDDVELVGAALPFGLKLIESLLAQSPNHRGLLLAACRGFVLYSYAFVDYPAQVAADDDLERARAQRGRARRLYLRGHQYGLLAIERSHPTFAVNLERDPVSAVSRVRAENADAVSLLYWTAASLGLAIASAPDDAVLLARLPEVQAMLNRALELDEGWDQGALHEFKVVLAGAAPGEIDRPLMRKHYDRSLALSHGRSASAHLAYAEVVAVADQDRAAFEALVEQALAVDPDAAPSSRLVNLLAHRRARWLASRIDDLILDAAPAASTGGRQP